MNGCIMHRWRGGKGAWGVGRGCRSVREAPAWTVARENGGEGGESMRQRSEGGGGAVGEAVGCDGLYRPDD